MTVLSCAQEAAILLNQDELSTLFSATERFAKELRVLANEAIRDIAEAHDWQRLTTLATITGDGSETEFAFPTDYDRMALKTTLAGADSNLDLVRATDLDQWAWFQNHPGPMVPGYWIALGGGLQVNPAPATGITYSYYYISRNIVSNGKAAFDADGDEFLLPERLLTLSLIWRWRAFKRQEYAEDLHNFEVAQAKAIAKDKGSRIMVVGRTRIPGDVRIAYPGPLGP